MKCHWSEVDEHEEEHVDDLIDHVILESNVTREKPSGGPVGDYVKRSEVEKLMEDNTNQMLKSVGDALSRESWKNRLRTYIWLAMMNRRK